MIVIFLAAAIGSGLGDDEQKQKASNNQQSAEETEKDDNNAAENEETGSETTTAENEESEEEQIELTPQQQMIQKIAGLIDQGKAFDTGSYVQGDIPKGEYAFIPFEGSGKYYKEEDSAGNIIDNENFDSFGYVYVHGAGNIETGGVLVSPKDFGTLGVKSAKELYEILNNKQNYKDSGWYKIGVDLPDGKYVIESRGEGYVAIMSGPVGNNEIIDNEIFNGRYSVNVSNGQYLKISNASIVQ